MSTQLERAVKAVFFASAGNDAPCFVYVESRELGGVHVFDDCTAARAWFSEVAAAGSAYVALFDRHDAWPDPAASRAPPRDDVAVAGSGAYHVGMHWDPDYVSADVEDRRNDPPDPELVAEARRARAVETARRASPDPWASTAATADPWDSGPSLAPELSVNARTDQLFYDFHPALGGRKLDPKRPGDEPLIHEWLMIRDFIVSHEHRQAADDRTRPQRAPHVNGEPTMNSLDPWTAMRSRPPSEAMYVLHATHAGAHHKLFGHGRHVPQGWGKYRRKKGLLLNVAPALHPVQEVAVTLADLDANNVLGVTVKIDGRTYHSAVDLSGAIAIVMKRLAKWHRQERRRMGRRSLVGADPAGAVDAAVGAAASALVGKMIDNHAAAVCGGWLSDIEHAVSHVEHDVGSALKSTLKALKGPIIAAATAAASAIPGIGPLAAPMVSNLINAAAGSSSAKGAVAALKQQALSNPQVQQALNLAQQTAAKATAAAQVAQTATAAQAGDPNAAAQLAQVQQAAQQGDPAAQQAAALAQTAQQGGPVNPSALMQQLLGALGGGGGGGGGAAPSCPPVVPPTGGVSNPQCIVICPPPACPAPAAPAPAPAGGGRRHRGAAPAAPAPAPCPAPVPCPAPACAPACAAATPAVSGALVGAAIDTMRDEAMHAAADEHEHTGAAAIAFVRAASGAGARAFGSLDEADDWLGSLPADGFLYAAYFDATDPTFPHPANERLGEVVHATPGARHVIHRGPATVGSPLAIMAALAAGAGGMAAFDRRAAIKAWFGGA